MGGDGEGADVVEGGMELMDLGGGESVAVLFWVDMGVVEYLIT